MKANAREPSVSTQDNQLKGIGIMTVGVLLLPLMDTAAKLLGETISSALIVLARFGFQSLFLLPLVWSTLQWPKAADLKLHLIRAVAISLATLCFFTAIQVMPLADTLAIFFVEPLIVTLLAAWLLKESFGWRRFSAVLVGLAGAMLIIQPSKELFGLRVLLPLGSAVFFALYVICTRMLAQRVPILTMQFFSGFFSSFVILLLIFIAQQVGPQPNNMFTLSMPEAWQWPYLVSVGLLAAIGHMVVVSAFKYAEASVLAPFQYMELISAALLGWLVFGDVPQWYTWTGGAILVLSGLYVFQREQQAAKASIS